MHASEREPLFDPKRYYRITEIIRDSTASPPSTGPLPIPRSTWYQLVASGEIPIGECLSARIVAWRGDVLNDVVQQLHARNAPRLRGRPRIHPRRGAYENHAGA